MKISAGIFFSEQSTVNNKQSERKNFLLLTAYCLLLTFLVSCSAAKYETAPVTSSLQDQQSSGFQEFKGERKSIVASWYGPDFHGRPTSSGELFNMYALSCAHREYPFGTKLRVVNKRNNMEVECIVNDRGPFVGGRDIDLSYAAAKRIGLIGSGTSDVTIEPIGRDLRYVKLVRYGAADGTMTIQVGSFKDAANANRLKAALELNHTNVYIMEADVGGSKYYRVRVGKFKNKGDASRIGNALANEGYNAFITRFEQQM